MNVTIEIPEDRAVRFQKQAQARGLTVDRWLLELAEQNAPPSPDEVLAKMFAKLKEKHIAFAIERLAQSWVHEPECGHGVESYYDPPGARKVAEKIKAGGGQIVIVPNWTPHPARNLPESDPDTLT